MKIKRKTLPPVDFIPDRIARDGWWLVPEAPSSSARILTFTSLKSKEGQLPATARLPLEETRKS